MSRWALLLLPAIAAAAEPKLPELKLAYAVEWKGIALGDAIYTLRPGKEPDCYVYESVTDPVGLVRMFYGKPREISEFCVRGGRVVPKRFSFVNTKRTEKNFTLEFDVAKGVVRGGETEVRDLPPNAQDRFGIQQAVRLWVLENLNRENPGTVEFPMVEDDRIKVYRFAITGREEIVIPAGRFDTVLVERVDNPKKSVRFWLAPEKGYLPIKVEKVEDGERDLVVRLKPRAP